MLRDHEFWAEEYARQGDEVRAQVHRNAAEYLRLLAEARKTTTPR